MLSLRDHSHVTYAEQLVNCWIPKHPSPRDSYLVQHELLRLIKNDRSFATSPMLQGKATVLVEALCTGPTAASFDATFLTVLLNEYAWSVLKGATAEARDNAKQTTQRLLDAAIAHQRPLEEGFVVAMLWAARSTDALVKVGEWMLAHNEVLDEQLFNSVLRTLTVQLFTEGSQDTAINFITTVCEVCQREIPSQVSAWQSLLQG
jgi:hypothetical protein